MKNKKYTYISLFSSAGIGCYGFKMEDFECVATNELIERRLNIQKVKMCIRDSPYLFYWCECQILLTKIIYYLLKGE